MELFNKPRILLLDIETRPATAHVWQLYDVTVGLEQIVDPGGILCVGAKWYGEEGRLFFAEWEQGHQAMLEETHAALSEADAVVTYNGDRFDLPKLTGEFLLADLPPPPPVTSIDIYKAVRKFGFISKKLGFVGPHLGLGSKVKHSGFSLWTRVMEGDPEAQQEMFEYCMQDVELLEEVYDKVRPYITNHPHLYLAPAESCGACGSKSTQRRGYRRTKSFRIQRIQCNDCGGWSDGPRQKVK